ncbi:MAG: alanine--tRNA ligase [Alphaproteobacteria bacterium]
MTSAALIRRHFLEYFAKANHQIVPSSPLVPRNDPSLMFTNAGMVQFKNAFTGQENLPYSRAVSTQKCVRAGGKHNDLENVGYTARHHTFFEMLGNFSFGDYFKETAIELAWNLITKEFGLPPEKLLVTVYGDDEEAATLWKKIAGFTDSKIIRINSSDNFWSMGDTGPCGPCSEIFYDHGEKIAGGPPGSATEDGDRFIEIWNLVFMQFEQLADGSRVPLPKPSIDTGMGMERLTAILQGKHDNYDTDLLRVLIEATAKAAGTDPDGAQNTSHRVIADHLRSSCFLLADGVLPSNEGRGYVLRRIMRRAMRHAHLLGASEPLMHRLVPALTGLMGEAFPELSRAEAMMVDVLRREEVRFRETLDRGLKLLEQETSVLSVGKPLSGDVAFKLYDTFGFPLDLTRDVLRGQGLAVDEAGFDLAMQAQKARARAAWSGSGALAEDSVWFGLKEKFGSTEFLGYDTEQAEAEILAILNETGEAINNAGNGTGVIIITNQTPFYAESGGQVGDSGIITTAEASIEITDTQKKAGGLWAHIGVVRSGLLQAGVAAKLQVDTLRRARIKAHHSATHLLHAALRKHFGEEVAQKGSLVDDKRLRFDISLSQSVGEAVGALELAVNQQIMGNHAVNTAIKPVDEAVKMGAMALFGEKYGDEVRVISMGSAEGSAEQGQSYSLELCGGVHVQRTGDIGLFKIITESAISAGVRRIEAVAGTAALEYVEAQENTLRQLMNLTKSSVEDLPARVQQLQEERKKLEKELTETKRKLAMGDSDSATEKLLGDVKLVTRALADIPATELKNVVDQLKKQLTSGVVVVTAVNEGKLSIVVGVTEDLTARFSAVELVKQAALVAGGKGGGGRPDLAQAGGSDGAAASQVVAAIEAIIQQKMVT